MPRLKDAMTPRFLSGEEAAGLLQRAMPGRDAAGWLEADRRYAPILPPRELAGRLAYAHEEVAAFARRLQPHLALRSGRERRVQGDRRQRSEDRRRSGERRRAGRGTALLERRLQLRPDRRSDLDRRIRGWVDRRCIPDRRRPPAFPDAA
jgi:hypothetical protein